MEAQSIVGVSFMRLHVITTVILPLFAAARVVIWDLFLEEHKLEWRTASA